MAKYPNITLTNAGLNMIAESQGSGQLIFTNIKLGDSSLNVGEDIKTLNDVKNPLLIADISAVDDTTVSGQITLTAVISNAAVTIGFFARELGIYAKVGSDGAEKLYAYTNAGNYADYMPDKNTPINENQIKITLIVGNASNVTALINSSIVYTTLAQVQTEIQTHDAKTEAHSDAFNAHNNDAASHADIRALLKKAGAMPLGTILPFLSKNAPDGWLSLETGALVSRTAYPDLWAWIQSNAPLITDAAWQAEAATNNSVGKYSSGDGATTFRLPKILDFVQGGLTSQLGSYEKSALPNIVGGFGPVDDSTLIALSGVFYKSSNYALDITSTASGSGGLISFDASRLNGAYKDGQTIVQPPAVHMVYYVRAFDSAVNQGTADITALANEMIGKVDKTTYVADFIKNFGLTGYQKLPSGLIIQWGQPNTTNGVFNVTFPIAFPNACLKVFAGEPSCTDWSAANITVHGVYSYNASGCVIKAATLTAGSSAFGYAQCDTAWFAIGY